MSRKWPRYIKSSFDGVLRVTPDHDGLVEVTPVGDEDSALDLRPIEAERLARALMKAAAAARRKVRQ